MVFRIFVKGIENWCHEKVDHFILQQSQLRQKNLDWVRSQVFNVEPAYDQHEIFWCEFLDKLQYWLK